MCIVTINKEKSGIEVRFETKPDASVLEGLKEHGFRWSSKQKMWYAKQNDERMAFVETMASVTDNNNAEKDQREEREYDLFELTRTDRIGSNVNKLLCTKDIAALIKDHMKKRFPMCKFSVRTSGYSSIYIKIVSSPFEKGSNVLDAIARYFEAYADSYNYCTCEDPYGDYGSSHNFYGAHNPIECDYKQIDMTDEYADMELRFQQASEEFEKAEKIRMEEEYAKQVAEQEAERKRNRIEEKKRKAKHDKVETGVVVKDLDSSDEYFLENLVAPGSRKEDSVSEYINDNAEKEYTRCNAKISREVFLSKELYEVFSNQLMDDWSFIKGTGGSRTEDRRINGIIDFYQMTEDERKTVEWYSYNCVLIYCDNEPMLVVDAQGFMYCRYVFLVDGDTIKTKEHKVEQTLSEEDRIRYYDLSEELVDASAEIIIKNGWSEDHTWQSRNFNKYKEEVIRWIDEHHFPLSVHVVRAIPENMNELKGALYRVLTEVDGVQHQFMKAGFVPGQKITIVQISDLGGMSTSHVTFDSFECGKYAQYDNAVKLMVIPERKRNLHYMWIYRDILIYDGWLDAFPEELFYTIERKDHVTTKMSKFMSFDHAQYDVALEYFKGKGAKLLVNTYKPAFGI